MAFVQTGIVARLSYPVLFEPKSYNNDPTKEKFYSCDLLIPKSDVETLKTLENVRKKAVRETWASFNNANFEALYAKMVANAGNKKGLFCGDEKAQIDDKYEAVYSGHWYLKATNLEKPLLVDRRNLVIGEDRKEIFYAGCWVKALLSVGAYEFSGKGIRNTLRGLQFFKDDTRWGGNSVAKTNEFSNLDNDSMNFDKILVDEDLPF